MSRFPLITKRTGAASVVAVVAVLVLLMLLAAPIVLAYSYSSTITVSTSEYYVEDFVIYSSTSDGYLVDNDAVYAVCQADLAADAATDNAVHNYIGQSSVAAFDIWRSFFYFDTTGLPDNSVVTSAVLYLYGAVDTSTADFDIVVQNGMSTYPHDPLVVGDYNTTQYTGDGGSINTVDFATGSYNEIILNSTGMSWVSATAATKLTVRSYRDIIADEPAAATNEYVQVWTSDAVDPNSHPKLVLSYYYTTTADYDMLPVMVDCNVSLLADNGYISSSGLDTSVVTNNGVVRPHMLATDKILTAMDVLRDSQINSEFTAGNDPIDSFDIITGYGGFITVSDTDPVALEPADSFRLTLDGYINTDAGASKNLLDKDSALTAYVDAVAAGTINVDAYVEDAAVYSAAADGYLVGSDAVYAVAQQQNSADSADDTAVTLYIGQNVPGAFNVWRSFLYFDTSLLPDGVTIDAATLQLYGHTDNSAVDFDIMVYSDQVTDHPVDPLHVDDFDEDFYYDAGGAPAPPATEGNAGFDTVGFVVGAYNDIVLNADGISWINDTGITEFVVASGNDISVPAAPGGDEYVIVYSSDEAGTTKDPKLVIDYHGTSLTAIGITSGEHEIIVTGGDRVYSTHSEYPSQDNFITSLLPDHTWPASYPFSYVSSDTDDLYRSLLEFNIAWGVDVPAGATITDATLTIYPAREPLEEGFWYISRTYEAYKMTQPTWLENQVTWNDFKTGSLWGSAGGDYVSPPVAGTHAVTSNSWFGMDFDVTAIVQDAQAGVIDPEFLIRDSVEAVGDSSMLEFFTVDYTEVAYRPRLDITYYEADTNFRLMVDGVTEDTALFNEGSITDAVSDWVIGAATTTAGTLSYNTLSYINYFSYDVSGAEVVRYEPVAIVSNIGEEGTVDAGTATTIDDAVLVQADDFWNGARLIITGTTDNLAPLGETSVITDFVVAPNNRLTFTALSANVDIGDTYTIDLGHLIDEVGSFDGWITWGVNPDGSSTSMGSLVSAWTTSPFTDSATSSADVLETVEVSDWFQDTDASRLTTNPLRPLVTIMSNTTALTEAQAWQFLGLVFVVAVTVSAFVAVRGHLLITGAACSAAILLLTVWTIWPLWTLVFILPAILSSLISERTPAV